MTDELSIAVAEGDGGGNATVAVCCCAYSYIKLNDATDSNGGSVTYIEELTGRSTGAGIVGWTLVVGYIGAVAMYAYAFGRARC